MDWSTHPDRNLSRTRPGLCRPLREITPHRQRLLTLTRHNPAVDISRRLRHCRQRQRHHAEALREALAGLLAPLGLRLSEEKTRVVDIDEGVRVPRLPHPTEMETRNVEALRLRGAVT